MSTVHRFILKEVAEELTSDGSRGREMGAATSIESKYSTPLLDLAHRAVTVLFLISHLPKDLHPYANDSSDIWQS